MERLRTPGWALLVLALILSACGGTTATPTPMPTPTPTEAPTTTPATLPAGPLAGIGALDEGPYRTPVDFMPAFGFDIRSTAWRTATEPDQYGFLLATPNLARAHAIIAVALPAAPTLEAFMAEMTDLGLEAAALSVTDRQVDGVPAIDYAISNGTGVDAFRILTANGEVQTALGGPLFENRVVYVAAPGQPFLLLLSQDADGGAETRFVFDALLRSIAFE